jgi:hypothetical protein
MGIARDSSLKTVSDRSQRDLLILQPTLIHEYLPSVSAQSMEAQAEGCCA